MKRLFQILILIVIIISCRNDLNEKSIVKKEKEEIKNVQKDTFSFDGDYDEEKKPKLKSELKSKLEKLRGLENNYLIQKIGKSTLRESIIYHGLEKLPKLSSDRRKFNIKNFDKFKESIVEINYAFIKGTKDLGSKTFPRARVEELIFRSEESAINLTTFVIQLKGKGIIWEDIDKSPSSIFNEGNRVYYISSGGWYMKPFYQEIEKKMKKEL